MSLFNSKNEEESFKKQLIEYFNLKKDQEIVMVLHSSELEYTCDMQDYNDWDGAIDIYTLCLKVPMNIYVKLDDRFDELGTKIHKAASHVIRSHIKGCNRIIGYVSFRIQINNLDQTNKEVLLEAIESVKTSLIARATGLDFEENEYKINRKILLDNQKLKTIVPSFIKYYSNLAEFWTYIQPKYSTYRERREYIIEEFKPLISFAQNTNQSPIYENINAKLSKFNSRYIEEQWSKGINRLTDGDLAGAITVASTLVEGTIKSILDELNIEYSDEKDKLPKLYRVLANNLKLSPNQHNEEIFKQILGGCHSIIQGLGSLRNKTGDAHAQVKRPVKLALRHAELAVNSAGTMSTFLIATLENSRIKDLKS